MKKTFICLWAFTSMVMGVRAQTDSTDVAALYDLSLEDLMNIEISVASKNTTSNIRETPGVISTISRNDIQRSGARDLLEILQLLAPGFSFGADVEGVVGVGIRGLWAHEGKVLLMIDGKSINEEQFATTQFGNHINADIIEKIEIIRGPGSSIYGGYAELGVINIITRKPTNGGYASITHSYMSNIYSHKNIAAGAGIEHNDFQFSVNFAYNKGYRSQDDHTDFEGNDTSFLETNELNSTMVNTNLDYKGLKVSYLLDKYETTTMDLWGTFSPIAYKESYNTHALDLRYDFEFGNLKITPYAKAKEQLPWHTEMIPEEYTNLKTARKITGGLVGQYKISDQIDFTLGGEYYIHKLIWPDEVSGFEELARSGEDEMSITSLSAFAQGTAKLEWFNVMAGVRMDAFDEFGTSVVPRFAITKVLNDFHFKGMISGSFRTPGGIIPNRTYDVNTKIDPEKGWSYEVEAGYKFLDHSWITLNGFYHDLQDVIVYQTDGSIGFYGNGGSFGSTGIEATYRYITDILRLNVNYAFYQPVGDEENDYITPGQSNYYLGFSNHRLNITGNIKIKKDIYANFAGKIYGNRYGIVGEDGNGSIVEENDPRLFLDVNIQKSNILFENLNASVGVHNILDNKFIYYQAYNGGHSGLPSLGRSFVINIDYLF